MPNMRAKNTISIIGILILVFFVCPMIVRAENETEAETAAQQSIKQKKTQIDQINQQIKAYQKQIDQKQAEQTTLSNELDILQNRIEKTQLEMDETNAQIDVINEELQLISAKMQELQKKMNHEKDLIRQVLQKIQSQDDHLSIELFYGTDRFSALIDTVQKLQQINTDLASAVTDAKRTKTSLEQTKQAEENTKNDLNKSLVELDSEKTKLNNETEAKQVILASSQQSEKRFQRLLADLRDEQKFVQNQIQQLQSTIENKIPVSERIGGGLLAWPLTSIDRGLTARFHDPTYPFRNLFEHPGIDLPAPTGTAVHAAASGYVAWTRRGAQYGNYVMIIHTDGIATLYAHLSRIDVIPDQYVPRGGQVGLVGMTGLATGPHLHFEVRKDGLPTDPLNYLSN